MASTTDRRLSAAERRAAAANAAASARLEGLDPSAVQPAMDAWARGELTVDEMVAAGLAIAHGAADQAPQAA
ncbi:MAG TPA: hypothetical protein VGI55_15800 [Solirubrobacteraceae bacterium]|jgi:hypothetical protein